jgi:hypothetical protein
MKNETYTGLTIGLSVFSAVYFLSLTSNSMFMLLSPIFILIIYFSSKRAAVSLCLLLLVTTVFFQWAIMRITFDLHNDYYTTKNVIFSKGMLFYLFVLMFFTLFIKNIKENIPALLIFSVLVFFSLVRSPNLGAGMLYVLNTWLPLLVLLIWCSISPDTKKQFVLEYVENARYTLNITILLYVLFWLLNFEQLISWELSPFINYHRTGDVDDFFIGNTTKLAGSTFYRNASIIMDPIVAGYFLSQFSFLMLVLKKYLLSIFLFILMILTLSKGAFLLFFFSALFYFSYKRLSYKTNVIMIIFAIILLIFVALNSAGKNSSYIHVLGLVAPFASSIDVNYFIGHNISTGGGLTGSGSLGLAGGMESLVGTLQYQMGLVGVLLYFIIFYKILRSKFSSKDEISRIEYCTLAGSFINSFLQENAFNLPFTVIKIFAFLYLISVLNIRSTKSLMESKHAVT